MNNAANTAIGLLKSKTFWTVTIILVLLFIVWKNWSRIEGLFKRDVTDYTDDAPLTSADKARLDTLAQHLFAEIDGVTWSTEYLQQAAALDDRELNYLARQYPNYSDGESLRDAIDNEAISGDVDAQLISRLNGMNL